MPNLFHGTSGAFAQAIVTTGVDVGRGSGEFGVGFYTQHRLTDAWTWAIARWPRDAGVVEVVVPQARLDSLKCKGPLDHRASDRIRNAARKMGVKVYRVGVDVVIGTIQGQPNKTQEKFESDSAETLLNSAHVTRRLHRGT